MNSDYAKAISTAAIWLSVAFALGVGLFRMNGGSSEFFFMTTLVVVAGATLSTLVVWLSGRRRREAQGHGFEVIRDVHPVAEVK